jgi:NADH dehydrogenase (ubiquinone) 1 alpha subcomplex subunit 6
MDYDILNSVEQCRVKLREEFEKNGHVTDIRVIDMLVIKGQMELKETVEIWKHKCHVMTYFKETVEPKPMDFYLNYLQVMNKTMY